VGRCDPRSDRRRSPGCDRLAGGRSRLQEGRRRADANDAVATTRSVGGQSLERNRIPKDNAAKNAASNSKAERFALPKRIELLRYGLLEHAVDFFVGRVAAGLTGLCCLQSLIGGALSSSSGRLGLVGRSGGGIRGCLRGGGVLHSAIGNS